jgi:hypothetical protein
MYKVIVSESMVGDVKPPKSVAYTVTPYAVGLDGGLVGVHENEMLVLGQPGGRFAQVYVELIPNPEAIAA